MNQSLVQDTLKALEAFGKAYQSPIADPVLGDIFRKASTFTQSGSPTSGLTFYDLEAGAKFLYPVITPLRNMIPRVSGAGGIQAAWRAITAINPGSVSVGVSVGNRGGVMAVTVSDYTAAYKGIGLESSVDFEAQYAGQPAFDPRAYAAKTLLESVMIGEEGLLLGGNGSAVTMGTTPTPTVADVTTGGSLLANTAYRVICVALTLQGYIASSVSGGVVVTSVRTNADGSSDTVSGGGAQKSVAGTVSTAADASDTHQLSTSVAAVAGAVAYAWFWGVGAGNETLGAITTINSVLISADATGTQLASALPSADNSLNSLVFDGLMYQAWKTGSNAYISTLATGTAGTGTPLTSDSAGGIVQIDAALKSFWDNYKLSPDTIWVNSQEQQNISTKILTGGSNAAQRFTFNVDQGVIAGGVMARSYLNKFSMAGAKEIPIKLHPTLPPGTLMFTTSALPYPLSNVSNVMQVRTRQDYYQIEWPLVSRKYQYGVYADEVLQHYFPPSMGLITNIANG